MKRILAIGAAVLALHAPVAAAAFAKASAPKQEPPPRIPPQVRAMADAGQHVRVIVGLRAARDGG